MGHISGNKKRRNLRGAAFLWASRGFGLLGEYRATELRLLAIFSERVFYPFRARLFQFVVRTAAVQSKHALEKLKPEKGNHHQQDYPPPRQAGEWPDFKVPQGGENNNNDD
jgi:hypothetical protein